MYQPKHDFNKLTTNDKPLGTLTLITLMIGIEAAEHATKYIDYKAVDLNVLSFHARDVTKSYLGHVVFSEKQALSVASSLIEMSTYSSLNYFKLEEVLDIVIDQHQEDIKKQLDEDSYVDIRPGIRKLIAMSVARCVKLNTSPDANTVYPMFLEGIKEENIIEATEATFNNLLEFGGEDIYVIKAARELVSDLIHHKELYICVDKLDLDNPASRKLYIPRLFPKQVSDTIMILFGDKAE